MVKMTDNENVKTFDEISHHLELEDERFMATKPSKQDYVVETNLRKTLSFKHNGN